MTAPGRPSLGHTETVLLKLHPDLKKYVDMCATANYCTQAEFIRRLIIADMRKDNKWSVFET